MPKLQCHRKECGRVKTEFSFFSNRRRFPKFEGNTFCSEACLWTYFENELNEKWRSLQPENSRKIPRPKLGTILMETAKLKREQLEEAVRMQNRTRTGRIGEWLQQLGFVEERQITEALSKQYGLPLINLRNFIVSNDAVRMIPGKVAKCSDLVPVGFDDDRSSMCIAIAGPVKYDSLEAIRRMVHKGSKVYIGNQSEIHKLMEKVYEPEDLDLDNAPSFRSREDLVAIGSEIISTAIDQKALDIQAELVPDFFWARLEFSTEAHHYFYRFNSIPEQYPVAIEMPEEQMPYAVGAVN